MAFKTSDLKTLHHLHLQLAELRARLDRGPRQIAARVAAVQQLEVSMEEAEQTAQKTRIAIDQKQLDLKSGEGRISDRRTQLNSASSNREYQTLLDEIKAAEMANSVLEDEILEGLDKIEQLEGRVHQARSALETGREELEKLKIQVAEQAELIGGDVQRVEAKIQAAEAELPSAIRSDYDRIVRGLGADALAAIEEGVCTGCGQQIPINMQSDLQMGRFLFCLSCGRIVYQE